MLGSTLLSRASSNLDFRDCGAKAQGCYSPPSPGPGARLSARDWLLLSKMGCLPFFSCWLSCEFLVPGSLTSWEQGLARGRAGPTSLQQEGWECGSLNSSWVCRQTWQGMGTAGPFNLWCGLLRSRICAICSWPDEQDRRGAMETVGV